MDSPVNAVESAFDGGVVWLEVDAPIQHTSTLYAGARGDDARVVLVHVMSKAVGGEVRGYVLTGDGALRIRFPNYTGTWPAMDAAVLARVPGATRVVAA